MSGYVEAGYAIALVTLSGYALSVLGREKAATRRLEAGAKASAASSPDGADGDPEAAGR